MTKRKHDIKPPPVLNRAEALERMSDVFKVGGRPVSVQDRKFLSNMMEGMSAKEAYIEVFGEDRAANPAQAAANKRRRLQHLFLVELEKRGISTEQLVSRFQEGLNATRTEYFSSKDGVVQDERTDPDWEVRRRYLDMLMKSMGQYAPTQVEHQGKVDVASKRELTDENIERVLGQIAEHVSEVHEKLDNDESLTDDALRRFAGGEIVDG